MKKLLLGLTLALMPLSAYAASQTTISNTVVNTTIQRFKPIFCQSTAKIANNIESCYKKTKVTDPKINQCILMDLSVTHMTILADQERAKQGEPLFSEAAPFLAPKALADRIDTYVKPQFKNTADLKEMLTYYATGSMKITKTMISQCQ